jgi:hypothetical protein
MVMKNLEIPDVDRIHRHGVGDVYKGTATIGDIAGDLIEGVLEYAPKYQRGASLEDYDETTLMRVTDERLDIDAKRAATMAAKFLMGFDAEKESDREDALELFNVELIWNIRKNARMAPEYDEDTRMLTVHSTITVPDSAHRHYMCYLLLRWKEDVAEVPDEVQISTDGRTIDELKLRDLLNRWDPFDRDHSGLFITIYNLDPENEGRLFDEYNVEGKRPTAGAAIDMHPTKTSSRRFVRDLMEKCPIFERGEIEIRRSTIGKGSRKITTLATLDAAIRPFQKDLLEIQKDKSKYQDLLDFFCAFYTEWASHYTEFQPMVAGKPRQDLRKKSFAMSNIIFFPMFRLAFELWRKYDKGKVDWHSEQEWKDGLARLAGEVTAKDADGTKVKVPVMAREHVDEEGNFVPGNPEWQGKILIQQFDQNGNPTGWSLSSTRQTRDSAYHYLVQVAQVEVLKKGSS